MSKIRDVLAIKGQLVHSMPATSGLLDAVKKMHEFRIGCLVVLDENDIPSGMLTERDVVRQIATADSDLSQVTVRDVMTTEVIVCALDDPIDSIRSVMKNQYVRQLPVVDDDGHVAGIVSLGDVNSHMIREEATEIKYLHDYIEGRVR